MEDDVSVRTLLTACVLAPTHSRAAAPGLGKSSSRLTQPHGPEIRDPLNRYNLLILGPLLRINWISAPVTTTVLLPRNRETIERRHFGILSEEADRQG